MSRRGQFYSLQPSTLKKLTEWQKGYIAGILDGEGHLYIVGEFEGSSHGRIRVRMTDECVINALANMTGVGILSSHIPSQRRKDGEEKKRVYEWSLQKRMDVKALLEVVLPFLVLKGKNAKCLLELESLKDQGVNNGYEVRRLVDKISANNTRHIGSGPRAGREGLQGE